MELISRDEAIKRIQKVEEEPNYQHDYEGWRDGLIIAENIVDELPTIEERKEGRWIHDIHYGLKLPEHRCSICGEWEYSDTESKYCPNCGAYMKGE